MQELLQIFERHKETIVGFILSTLENNGKMLEHARKHPEKLFARFPSIELIYTTDGNFLQNSPNIYRNRLCPEAEGKERSYLNARLRDLNGQFSISDPYQSSATGHLCVTLMKKEEEGYLFIDFRLRSLLARLGLIELHENFDRMTKLFYAGAGFSLMFFASLAMGYAMFAFGKHLLDDGFTLNTLFKPIIAITLGLAIFDLAKTILEREVYYKSYGLKDEESVLLSKFMIAIIIALSIEALMVVFKIALRDYREMIYGVYLILGVGIVIVALGLYNRLSRRPSSKH